MQTPPVSTNASPIPEDVLSPHGAQTSSKSKPPIDHWKRLQQRKDQVTQCVDQMVDEFSWRPTKNALAALGIKFTNSDTRYKVCAEITLLEMQSGPSISPAGACEPRNYQIHWSERLALYERRMGDVERLRTENGWSEEIAAAYMGYLKNIPGMAGLADKRLRVLDTRERILERYAELFRVGEEVLRAGGEATTRKLLNKIYDRFSTKGAPLNEHEKKVLHRASSLLMRARGWRDEKIAKMFKLGRRSLPASLAEQEKTLNTHSSLSFLQWATHLDSHADMSLAQRILSANVGKAKKIMATLRIEATTLQSLDPAEQILVAWQLAGGMNALQFNLTDYPGCIMTSLTPQAFGDSSHDGSLESGSVQAKVKHTSAQAHKKVKEHEYQHYLNRVFVAPLLLEDTRSLRPMSHEDHTHTIHARTQWGSFKDEFASYARNARNVPSNPEAYTLSFADADAHHKPLYYGEDLFYIEQMLALTRRCLRGVGGVKIGLQHLVDIIRTSQSFDMAIERIARLEQIALAKAEVRARK